MDGNVQLHQTQMLPLDKLSVADRNPRRASREFMSKLQSAIDSDGFVQPVIINDRNHPDFTDGERKLTIVSGHQRVQALRELGEKEAPCIVVSYGRAQERKAVLRMNKLTAEWDDDALGEALYELEMLEKGAANEAGWADEELKKLSAFADDEPDDKKPKKGTYTIKQLRSFAARYDGDQLAADDFVTYVEKLGHETS